MDGGELLDQITIPTPCSMDWNLMRGDDRVRFCAGCSKQVYNLSAMTRVEMVDLIRTQDGEFCGQLYRRPDGSVVTSDCPRLESRRRPLQFHLRSIMAVIAAMATVLGFARLFANVNGAVPTPRPAPQRRLGGKVCIPRTVMHAIDEDLSGRDPKPA